MRDDRARKPALVFRVRLNRGMQTRLFYDLFQPLEAFRPDQPKTLYKHRYRRHLQGEIQARFERPFPGRGGIIYFLQETIQPEERFTPFDHGRSLFTKGYKIFGMAVAEGFSFPGFEEAVARILSDCLQHVVAHLSFWKMLDVDEGFVDQLV